MNTIATESAHNELIACSVESTGDSKRFELGDDTGEIPLALMQEILNS